MSASIPKADSKARLPAARAPWYQGEMRRVLGPALLGLVCSGCYLFSDEPKARKQAGDPPATSEQGEAAEAGVQPQAITPTPAPADASCPELLTGVESQARSIPSTCTSVRVRGQYLIDGGSLTIAAGVELRFEPGALIEVGRDRPGTLHVQGSAEQPVRMVADSVSDSGRWQGVRLHLQAAGSSITGLEISGASSPDHGALWIAAPDVQVNGLKIRSIGTRALELAGETAASLIGVELQGSGAIARASASAVAGLQGLTLEPGAYVEITPGPIRTTLEWPPNVYRLDGVVRIEGDAERPAQLSLTPGTELRMGPDARLVIGGLGPGSLSASAAAPSEAPSPDAGDGRIRLLAAEGTGPGAWSGLLVQDQGQLSLRNVELAFGGARDEGVIVAEGSASVMLEGCLLRSNLVGVELRGAGVRIEGFDRQRFEATPTAIRTTPALLGMLGPDNTYDELARVHVERGRIETDASWAAQAAPIVVHGDVFIDKGASLSVAPGTQLSFDAGVVLGVGYYEQATLDMRGTADAPIQLGPSDPAGTWGGIVLGPHSLKSRFEHVSLSKTSNAAAIELRETADATLVNIDCADCAGGVVRWDCKSTIGNIGVRAHAGTPTSLLAPNGC